MSHHREVVNAPEAPAPVGLYSHAVRAQGLLFCSGQVALDPESGELVGETTADQARRALQNLQAVCRAGGTSLDNAVRVAIYLTDMGDWAEVNATYEEFFTESPPARTAIGVAALPKGARVELDAVVALSD